MQCSCKRHWLGMKDWYGQGCSAICIIIHASSHRCRVYTHSQHVNIICHTNTHSEYGNDPPVFPYVWLPCFSVSVIMLFPNKQMPSFIRHLQQQLYSLSTINIFAAEDVLQWIEVTGVGFFYSVNVRRREGLVKHKTPQPSLYYCRIITAQYWQPCVRLMELQANRAYLFLSHQWC